MPNVEILVLSHPLGDLGVTHKVHLWLAGKHVVDFLLVLLELFRQLSRLRHYEQILVKIVVFEGGWVTLSTNFRGKGVAQQRLFASENSSPWTMTWRCLRDPTFSHFDTIPACDRQTDTHTDTTTGNTHASLAPCG